LSTDLAERSYTRDAAGSSAVQVKL